MALTFQNTGLSALAPLKPSVSEIAKHFIVNSTSVIHTGEESIYQSKKDATSLKLVFADVLYGATRALVSEASIQKRIIQNIENYADSIERLQSLAWMNRH